MVENLENLRKKVLYRSTHRGCKETDILFGDFVESKINGLSEPELTELADLLEVDDALLYAWFADLEPVPEVLASGIFQQMYEYNKSVRKVS